MSGPGDVSILDLFDHDREGLRHIGEAISLYLNYNSLVSLKRTCSTLYHFLKNSTVEETVFKRKLHHDWSVGTPVSSRLQFYASNLNTPVNNVKTVTNSNILFSTGKKIYQFDFNEDLPGEDETSTGEGPGRPVEGGEDLVLGGNVVNGMKLTLRLPSNSLNSKINSASKDGFNLQFNKVYVNNNENLERNEITQFDILKNYLIAGNNNGMLSVWDLETTELLNTKQLFGIITGLRCREEEDIIVTSHAGKSFDIGCISVRKMISPTELTVLWSVYQDIMPIFCFDVSPSYIMTLEWLGTFDLVHVGSASLYSRADHARTEFSESLEEQMARRSPERGLSHLQDLNLRFSSLGIFKDKFAALCTADEVSGVHSLLIWNLVTKTVIQDIVTSHQVGIFQVMTSGENLVTRDKNGLLCVWDLSSGQDGDTNSPTLLRTLDLHQREKFLSSDLDLRRLIIGKVGGVEMLDFWNLST